MGVCCCGVDVRPWRVRRDIGSRRMVYLPASRGGCPGLQENLCQLSWCYARRRYGACACGQAILANIWGKKVSTLWPSAHTQMPMMAPNSIPGEKLRQHYGLSVAKKRRTRRSHATGRYGGFVAIVGDV